MQPVLTNYRLIRPLRASGRSRLFEAVRDRDGRRVVAKVFDFGDETVEASVRHEFEHIRRLNVEGAVRKQALQLVDDQFVLIRERLPGVDLRELAEGEALPLALFWPIAAQVAEILARVHAQRVIHRDIKPDNLLFDAASGRAHVTGFGISVLLESERRHIYDHRVLSDALPYISPEQTGRAGRSVDARSDLYSLGVTFYELLTGTRPFESATPLELIHAHLVRTPRAPIELRPELPEALSRLVMKLLAKAPELRYPTAAGLAADLRELQGQHERPGPAFRLGRKDRATSLQLPHRLHGRAREQTELNREFDELVVSRTRRTTLLVGPHGVGKSALLSVLEIAAAGHGGYVLRGKFDPHRELPYSAFVEALAGIFEGFLSEGGARLARWRQRLLGGLGDLVGVMCEVVPPLVRIVGQQPAPPRLEPIESRDHLHVALDRLITTLSEDGPLVLMLDDLHHADPGSVALLETLVQGVHGPLFITGTLREDEVTEDRPIHRLLPGFGGPSMPRARVMRVEPLSADAIEDLLTDVVGAHEHLPGLAHIVTRKTGGGALAVGQLLSLLMSWGLLHPEPEGWRWDNAAIDAARIPDDPVAMIRARLENLSEGAQALLGHATCLGSRFGIAELARVSAREPNAVVASLWELIEADLLVGAGREYCFAHDSIQAAAQGLLAPVQHQYVHWRIGRELLATLEGSALDEQLFDVVEHLAAGAPDELEIDLRVEIATLNLRAGRRAVGSAAYDLALRYLCHGMEVLGEVRGSELGYDLSFEHAQTLRLAEHGVIAEAAFEELRAR